MYLSLNYLSDVGLAVGSALKLKILTDRLRIFEGLTWRSQRFRVEPFAKRCIGPTAWDTRCCCSSRPCWWRFSRCPSSRSLHRAWKMRRSHFVGFANFIAYLQTPRCANRCSTVFGCRRWFTVVVVPAAFLFAYALTRSCMPFRACFAHWHSRRCWPPSLLAAISFVYWFGNQGVLKDAMKALGIASIYGAPGIVISEVFAVFPHVLMIMVTALSRLPTRGSMKAANALGTSAVKVLHHYPAGCEVRLDQRHTLQSFTLVITGFGIPKVIGGNFNVLATDIFSNSSSGSRTSNVARWWPLVLLAPAFITFLSIVLYENRPRCLRRAPYLMRPPSSGYDFAMMAYCVLVSLLMLAVIGMAVFASFVKFWPYDLSMSLRHYVLGLVDAEVSVAFLNSLKLAFCTATAGTAVVFAGAYLMEKTRGMDALRPVVQLLALLPMAVPGLVLGLGYIFLFQFGAQPDAWPVPNDGLAGVLHGGAFLYHGASDGSHGLEGAGRRIRSSLGLAQSAVLQNVLACDAAHLLARTGRYQPLLFVNAMTTISAVVFLYSPGHQAGLYRHSQSRRGRRNRRRSGDGGLDRGYLACRVVAVSGRGWIVARTTQRWRIR